jgi:AcrR family transcriptional regulator
MGRSALYSEERILDAAREVIARDGVRGATIASIAQATGAPTGSIYHRFRSVDELLARAWMRAVRRGQAAVLSAEQHDDPLATAVADALATYDFCVAEPEDALLLRAFRLEDFRTAELSAELVDELTSLTDPVREPLRRIARGVFGDARARSIDALVMAVIDIPCGCAVTKPFPGRRDRLVAAVTAALT